MTRPDGCCCHPLVCCRSGAELIARGNHEGGTSGPISPSIALELYAVLAPYNMGSPQSDHADKEDYNRPVSEMPPRSLINEVRMSQGTS
jgi:hypothetical protein